MSLSLGTLTVQIGADIKDFQSKMNSVTKKVGAAGSRMKNVGQSMSMGVTLPIIGIGAAAVETVAKFDDAMGRVRAISGATGKQFQQLTNQSKHLGATTQFTAQQAASGQEFLARAGFKTKQILSAMPGVLNLAAASQTDLGTTADIASNILGGFNLKAGKAGMMADVMAKTVSSANTNVQQLGDAMKYAAPVAHAAGDSIQMTAAAIGEMSNAGIQGAKAGTVLRGGLTRLLKPTKTAKKDMKELGLNFYNSQGQMKPLTQIIGQLNTHMKGLTKHQKESALAAIFGQRTMAGWMVMMNDGPKTLGKFTKSLQHSGGTAKRQAKIMNDTLAGSFRKLLSALQGLALSFEGTLKPMFQKAAAFVRNLATRFSHLSGKTRKIILIVLAVAAAIGPLLVILGALAIAIEAIMSPVTLIILGIALLIAAFVYAYVKFKWFRDGVKAVFGFIKKYVMIMFGAVVKFIKSELKKIQKWWSEHGKAVMQVVRVLWDFLKPIFKIGFAILKSLVVGTWDAIVSMIKGAVNIILGIIGFFVDLVTGHWGKLWGDVKQILHGAIQFVWGYIQLFLMGKILGIFGKFVGDGVRFIRGFASDVGRWFGDLVSKAKGLIGRGFGWIKNTIHDIISSIGRRIASWSTDIGIYFLRMVDGIKSAVSHVGHILMKPFKDAWNFIKSIPGKIEGIFKHIHIPRFHIPHPTFQLGHKHIGPLSMPYPIIHWHAKGAIFKRPTVIGNNGFGEAGPEAAIPLQGQYMKPFAQAIADNMPQSGMDSSVFKNLNETMNQDKQIILQIDGQEFARATVGHNDKSLEQRGKTRMRAIGVTQP